MSTIIYDRNPWVYRQFLKDKLRVRERYWRTIKDSIVAAADNDDGVITTVIPDGITWRKYLKLIQELVAIDGRQKFRFVLLESAVELLDWRQTSPCIVASTDDDVKQLQAESSALHERNRIRKLLQDHSEYVIPYCDLSVRDTEDDEWEILGYSEMSVEDRSRHALMRAARLLGGSNVTLLVDSDTMEHLHVEHDDGIAVKTVCGFLDDFSVKHRDTFTDDTMQMLRETKGLCEENYARRNGRKEDSNGAEPEEMSEEQIHEGLRNGTLLIGRLEVTKANIHEAYVKVDGTRLFIDGHQGHFQHALHQDMVVVQKLPESHWGRPVGRRRLVHYQRSDEDDENDERLDDVGPTVPSARVVAIKTISRRTFVATMVDQPEVDERAILAVPMDVRIPKIRIKTRDWQKFVNQRLLIQVGEWETGSIYPSGHFIRSLGTIGELETEINCLLHEHEIQLEPFSASALASLPPEGYEWQIPDKEIHKRLDLRRSHRIFSVDPPGCQDIDDAMHARVLPDGDIEVGVHIADVTGLVPHASPLDKEAQVRGTTFYLVDRRFDMLPTLLSSDLCSLHGGKDRLAVSVIWTLSPDFDKVKSCWFGRSVIHNCQAMTYEQAHNILHDKPPDDPDALPPPLLTAGAPVEPSRIRDLKTNLSILQGLARRLRKDREEIGGAVDLSSGDLGSELKFVLDENGNPTKVAPKQDKEIHHTIAEMMIFANRYVAEKIYDSFPDSALLRVHRTVEQNRFEDLENALKAGGIKFDGSSNMSLAKSLESAKQTGKERATVNALWQSLATRAMSEALYICTGSKEEGGLGHYGLGIEKYTHFTSPIRRYADVVVHKQLLAALEKESSADRGPQDRTIDRSALPSIPDSSAISVLQGQGLSVGDEAKNDNVDDLLDSLIEGAEELALGPPAETDIHDVSEQRTSEPAVPYEGFEVERICDRLNRQNRLSKLSSMECQNLFLSLYFRDHLEIAQAVVTDVRINGFLVYVPKFDLKGPVYLSDRDGDVQIDPSLVGLPADSGFEPTLGFAIAPGYRRFPSGTCELKESNTNDGIDSLVIHIPSSTKPCVFQTLDVVTVQLSCDFSDVRARIPPPRLHLSSSAPAKFQRASQQKKVVSTMLRDRIRKEENPKSTVANSHLSQSPRSSVSIYKELSYIKTAPILQNVPFRTQRLTTSKSSDKATGKGKTEETMVGRRVFGGFVNPNTRSATQEAQQAAAQESAAQRRSQAIAHQARREEYDTNRTVERSVTARMQRISAEKRNARRSKQK